MRCGNVTKMSFDLNVKMFLHHLGIQPPVADMLGIFGAIKILLGQVDVVMGLHGVAGIHLLLNLLRTDGIKTRSSPPPLPR